MILLQCRWLSVGEALESLDDHVVSLYVMFCEYDKEDVSAGFLTALQQHKFIALLKGMRDIISKLNLLNVSMQTQGLSFTTLKVLVNATQEGLRQEWTVDPSAPEHPMLKPESRVLGGESFKRLVEQMKTGALADEDKTFLYELPSVRGVKRKIGGGEQEKHTIPVQGSCEQHVQAVGLLSSFAQGVRDSLKARFVDINELALFDVLHPSRVPTLDDPAFSDFGVQQLRCQ